MFKKTLLITAAVLTMFLAGTQSADAHGSYACGRGVTTGFHGGGFYGGGFRGGGFYGGGFRSPVYYHSGYYGGGSYTSGYRGAIIHHGIYSGYYRGFRRY